MAHISPFRALRPRPDMAEKIASPPYDVLSSAEARQAVLGNPYSFLHVTKSEVDLPETIDTHSRGVYLKAQENLFLLQDKGILFLEENPSYYIYELTMNGRAQTGLVCVSSIRDYENGIIKKHELTRPEKELDRINHIKTTSAQTGNVFLAYRTNEKIDALIGSWKNSYRPVYDFVAADGIGHRVWVISDETVIEQITRIFDKEIPATYIADGHHRAASAAKVGQNDFFLTTLFPADELQIMDYNRLVKDLNGHSSDELISLLEKSFSVTESDEPVSPKNLHDFGMYLDNKWYNLTAGPDSFSEDPIGVLDVSILEKNVLDPILGIKDVRVDARIDFVGGIRGLRALSDRVDSGEMKVAFSLYPVSMKQLFDIADSGEIMPPKSTWFEPKLRDGLLTHLIK